MLSKKGKYAKATQNRQFVWTKIIWPLILEQNKAAFTLQQYRKKRNEICKENNIERIIASRGLTSLLNKGIIFKENNLYFIHYRLIPYMRLKSNCTYSSAIHESRTKQ
ncbi:MAG: hypothetical protein OXF28_03445 [Thaumarchaeota archaeon]|nr:hypothetical protein [Nitrososphaerota archaeon]MCY3976169.1 hypothetical protein [Nitrososphaerota archaeon]